MVFGVHFHEYQIIGRHQPTATDQNPKLYRMRIFARTPAQAKSRYWYYLSQYRKVKKATGQILTINEIFEKKPLKIKNFGIFLRYTNRSGTSNLYKEYRDLSRVGAVQQLYNDMAGQYRTQFRNIQIVSVDEVQPKDVRRANIKQFHDSKIKFPLPHRVLKVPKKLKSTFVAHRPTVVV